MPAVTNIKVYPSSAKPEERFPYTRYRSMGLIQIVIGIIMLALGTYDLVLHFYPQWYSKKCDFWKAVPCENMKGRIYFWSPRPGLAWTLVASPIYAGIMLVISGFIGTCTCDTDCTSQRCLCHAFMSLSLLISAIFAPACVVLSFLQGIFAINNNLHVLRTVMPLCCGGLGIIAVVVCFVTMCLCCCFTDYDPEIPLVGYEDDAKSVVSRPSLGQVATAPPYQSPGSGTSSIRSHPRPSPTERNNGATCSPDMLKAYIRHLSDVSNMMAEMLVQTNQSPQQVPITLPLGFNLESAGGLMPHVNYTLVPNTTNEGGRGGDSSGMSAPKHKNYRKKTGKSRRKVGTGSSSSQTLPTVTSSSANSADEYDIGLPGQASPSVTELTDGKKQTRTTTSIV